MDNTRDAPMVTFPNGRFYFSIGVIFVSAVLVVLGVYFGELKMIFNQATMICLKCIGIG